MKNMLSLEAFADWAGKQPAEKKYDYSRSQYCAAAQYLQSIGVQRYVLSSSELPVGWDDALNPFPWQPGQYTFGNLAARLRKASAP